MTESETRTQAESSRLLYASLAKARGIAQAGLAKAGEDAEAFRFVIESIPDGVSAETHTLEEVDGFIVGALRCRSANIDRDDLRKFAYDIEGLLSDADEHLCRLDDESPK